MTLVQETNIAYPLPAGYTIRPVTTADVEAAVELFNTYSQWQLGIDQTTVQDTLTEWQEPGYKVEDSTQSVWDDQGHMVAFIEFYDMGEPHVRLFSWGVVHPEHQNQGIGRIILDWAIKKAGPAIDLAPDGARVVMHNTILSTNQRAGELLAERGFTHIRSFHRMMINLDQPPALPVVPSHITIRSIEPGEERIAIQTIYDSFRDHWGFTEQPFEQYYQRWSHHIQNDPHYDPALWFMALEGDKVAGVSLCYSQTTEDPDMAWVGSLGVRRAWRKQGLGTALLLHSFGEFYRRGKARAGLGVDATNLTGALRIYEKAGMHAAYTYHTYELELRPGQDLLTREIIAT